MLDSNLGLNLGLLASLVPAGALALALYQYRINSLNTQRQHRREQAVEAANEMEGFRDGAAATALKIIDYEDVPIGVGTGPTQRTVTLDREQLILALEIHSDRAKRLNLHDWAHVEKGELFSDTERAVRDIFDTLLVRLERIEALIRARVIGQRDFGDLFSYWLKLLAEQPREEDMKLTHFGNRRRRQLWRYIREYEYNGVIRLFQIYDRAAPIGTDPDNAFHYKSQTGRSSESGP
ncbi:hypothetical protein [Bradyrhizobium sp. SZCCHNS1054]|uniref:hypothetical protein n=1 Tax=Bradyrhizobium sp. SZCCHNS1054 TaxID=3057301 RepID=UPI002916B8A6|nr:hypothetical protein [Bradyrhizobium sp. SZCCHNS1054]